jgi:predicted nucleic acid-binding protein
MSLVIIDASVAHAWVLESQRTDAARALQSASNVSFVAPYIFAFELRSGLLKAERQSRLTTATTDDALRLIFTIVNLEPPADESLLEEATKFSRRHQLSFYDACYIETAHRLGAALASRDGPVLSAAARDGLLTYDAR